MGIAGTASGLLDVCQLFDSQSESSRLQHVYMPEYGHHPKAMVPPVSSSCQAEWDIVRCIYLGGWCACVQNNSVSSLKYVIVLTLLLSEAFR